MQPIVYSGGMTKVGVYSDPHFGRTTKWSYRDFEGEIYETPAALPGYEWIAEFKSSVMPPDFDFAFADGPTEASVRNGVKLAIDRIYWMAFGPDDIFEGRASDIFTRRAGRQDILHAFWEIMDRVQEEGKIVSRATVARELERQCQDARRWYRMGILDRKKHEARLAVGPLICDRLDRLTLAERVAIVDAMVSAAFFHPRQYPKVKPTGAKHYTWAIPRTNPARARPGVLNAWHRARQGIQ